MLDRERVWRALYVSSAQMTARDLAVRLGDLSGYDVWLCLKELAHAGRVRLDGKTMDQYVSDGRWFVLPQR